MCFEYPSIEINSSSCQYANANTSFPPVNVKLYHVASVDKNVKFFKLKIICSFHSFLFYSLWLLSILSPQKKKKIMWSALYPTQVQHNYISLFNQLYILLLLLKHMLDNQYLILYSIYKKRKQKKKKTS